MNDYLIEVDDLANLLQAGQVKLIDCRDDEDFVSGHIPGAIHVLDIFTYLCLDSDGGHAGMAKHFSKRLSELGISVQDQLVVYEDAMDNGYGRSCRGWFILSYLGVKQVKVLHGGLRAWVNDGLPLGKETTKLMPVEFLPTINQRLIVQSNEMLAALEDVNIQIIDCRDYAEWIGANSSPYGYNFCPRKGRIPGSKWIEWYRMMTLRDGIPWFKSKNEILEICEKVGITPQKTVYLYCFKGARTSNTMIALKLAGFTDVRNYFNSWNEWSRDLSLPIQTGYPKI